MAHLVTHISLIDFITVTLVDENCFSKVFDVVANVEVSAVESIGFFLVKADSIATA